MLQLFPKRRQVLAIRPGRRESRPDSRERRREPLSPRCPSLAICNAHRASCTASPVGAADASGCPFDRTHVREGTIAEMWPAACVVRQSAGESMVFGRLIAMPRRSIDRTPAPGRPDARIVRGWRPVDAVAGLLSCGSRWNMARLHQLQSHSRDVLVFGRLRACPWTGRRAAGSSPTASQRPDGGSRRTPGVGPVGSDGRPAGRAPRIMVVDDEPGIHLMART